MKVQFEKTIGGNKIIFTEEPKNQVAFFKLASFVSDLPTQCGNCDKTDLGFVYRRTDEGHQYCEVECADCEHVLKFGQHKEGGTVFPKGWEPPYEGSTDDEDEDSDDNDEEDERPRTKKGKATLNLGKSKKADDEDEDEEDSEEDSDDEDEDDEDSDDDDSEEEAEEEEKKSAPKSSGKRNINDIAAKFGIKT